MSPEFLNIRGMRLVAAGDIVASIDFFTRAIALAPANPDYQANLGLALLLRGNPNDLESAIAHFRAALALNDDLPVVHGYLGGALSLRDEDAAAAIEHLQRSLVDPSAFAHRQLALIHARNGETDAALRHCDAILAHDPHNDAARTNRSYMLLAKEMFDEGWPDFEHRLNRPEERERTAKLYQTAPTMRPWQGEDISKLHLLVHAEGGMGDSLQFYRFLPDLAKRCARLSIYDRPEARRLIEHNFANDRIVVCRDVPTDADVCMFSMSAVHLLGIAGQPVARPPYLQAANAAQWAARMAAVAHPRVGIVWAGEPSNVMDARRSLKLAQIESLFNIPAGWVSLQLNRGGDDCPIYDAMTEVSDWLDTAGVIANLDLVIAVDTAVAHLAGAMGKPVWLLNRYDTCWRWGLTQPTSPWYQTMRIYRQAALGDWSSVIRAVTADLHNYLNITCGSVGLSA